MTNLAPSWGLNPEPRGHEFHRFGKKLIAHYNHASRLSALCHKVKMNILGDYINFDDFGHIPQVQRGSHEN